MAAAADYEGGARLSALGEFSNLLGMLASWVEDKALCLGDVPKLKETTARLKSIEDAMSFVAAPPVADPEGTWIFDKGNPVEAVVEQDVQPVKPVVEPEDLPPLRKRKRARAAGADGKKDLERIVRSLPPAADVHAGGALAASIPCVAQAAPVVDGTGAAEGPLAEQPKKKKRKKGKGAAAAQTPLDPYF